MKTIKMLPIEHTLLTITIAVVLFLPSLTNAVCTINSVWTTDGGWEHTTVITPENWVSARITRTFSDDFMYVYQNGALIYSEPHFGCDPDNHYTDINIPFTFTNGVPFTLKTTAVCPCDCSHPNAKVLYEYTVCTDNPITVSCSANPSSINTNQSTTFYSSVSGGSGSYNYSWTGACTSSGQNCSNTFPNQGTYTSTVTVTSGSQTTSASCSVNVNQSCTNHSYKQCYNNDSYWYDSCGSRQELYQSCSGQGCQNGQCNSYSNLSVSCYASPNSINTNQSTTFYSSVSGGSGSYNYSWTGACTGSFLTCTNYFSNPGTYNATITVTPISGGSPSFATCSVNVNQQNNYNSYLGCYNNDVYWFDNYGTRQSLYQDCGSGYCQNGSCVNYYNQCECYSGPCCDGCHYKGAWNTCNTDTQTEYACPWGSDAGSDVGYRTKTRSQYCSGYNSQCSGSWSDWTNLSGWTVAAYCNNNQTCLYGVQTCQPYYTPPTPTPSNYKGCYNNDVYWFNGSTGARLSLYRTCNDNNTCTTDSCSANKCSNVLNCNGATCAKGSADYCYSCQTLACGDGVCNCGESIASCSKDCGVIGLALTLFGKQESDPIQWSKFFNAPANQNVDFLAVVSNGLDTAMNNVILKVTLPSQILYTGNLQVNNLPYTGDITQGITLGSLAPKTTQTVSFKGQVVSNPSTQSADAIGTVTTSTGTSQDSVKIIFQGTISAAIQTKGFLAGLLGINLNKPLYILLGIIIAILVILGISRIFRNLKGQ